MTEKIVCRDPALHHMHLCKLTKHGQAKEIAARTTSPAYVCHNCGLRADREGDLCNASPLVPT